MNVENFLVRPRRRYVEKYARSEAWATLSDESREELAREVAGLPTALPAESEEAKRFDLLILRLQLALLKQQRTFAKMQKQVSEIAGLLEDKASIPLVRDQLELIQEIQTDEWWQDVTVPLLETARRRLRGLVGLIEKSRRKPVYTDFADELGDDIDIALPGFGSGGGSFVKFREKARAFLRAHQDHAAILKLRTNRALTATDLAELERMLAESGIGGPEEVRQAKESAQGLGLFIRSLVGLDREAAKGALADFLDGSTLTGNQIEFINLIIDHLTEHGQMEPGLLYESPFTDLTPQGPEGLFTSAQVDELLLVIANVRASAVAA